MHVCAGEVGWAREAYLYSKLLIHSPHFQSEISTSERWKPNMRVLSMSLADPAEAVSYLG